MNMKFLAIAAMGSLLVSAAACSNAKTDDGKSADPTRDTAEKTALAANEEQPDHAAEEPEAESGFLRIISANDNGRHLAPQAGNSYRASNMIDGNLNTAWAYNIDHFTDGKGPVFTLNAKRIDAIEIVNGYAKNASSYRNNTRASEITIYRTDYSSQPIESEIIYRGSLADTRSPQRLKVSPRFDNSLPTKHIALEFGFCDIDADYVGYYMGDKWNDLCMTEFRVIGI